MRGIEGEKHPRLPHDPADTHHRQYREPAQHHRAENPADRTGAMPLNQEQSHQHQNGDRQDRDLRVRRCHMQAFHGTQHRNRRRDGAVREEQRSAQDAEQPIHSAARTFPRGVDHQRSQCQHPALTLVVGVQYHADIFEQDDKDQRPENQRQHTEHMFRRDGDRGAGETGRHGIEGAGADVAEHDTERRKRQWREPSTRVAFDRHVCPLFKIKGPPLGPVWLGD